MQPAPSLLKSQQGTDTRAKGSSKGKAKGKQTSVAELAREAHQAEALAVEARLNRDHAKAAIKATEEAKRSAAAASSQGFSGNADDFLFFADTCFMQGRADAHENRHVVVKDLAAAGKALKMPLDRLDKPLALFAIYDGHLGPQCSEYCAQNYHKKLLPRLTKISPQREQTVEEQIRASLRTSLADLDTEFCSKFRTDRSGCCAQIALLVGRRLYVAGLGSARASIFTEADATEVWDAEVLHGIHLAAFHGEQERVVSAGGAIIEVAPGMLHVAAKDFEQQMRDFRIQQSSGMGCGSLLPPSSPFTRSLGDRGLKIPKAIIEPSPDIRTVVLQRSHRGFALYCDGVAEVMSDNEIAGMLQYNIGTEKKAAGEIVQEAYKRGSVQNLTTLAVYLRWPNKRTHEVTFPSSVPEQPRKSQKTEQRASAGDRSEAYEHTKSQKTDQRASAVDRSDTKAAPPAPTSPKLCLPESWASRHTSPIKKTGHMIGETSSNVAIEETVQYNFHGTVAERQQAMERIQRRLLADAGPLYQDADGDIAHEFLVEAKTVIDGPSWLLKTLTGIVPALHC